MKNSTVKYFVTVGAIGLVVGLFVGMFAGRLVQGLRTEEIVKNREIELSQSIVCYEYEVYGREMVIDIEDVNVNVGGCQAW